MHKSVEALLSIEQPRMFEVYACRVVHELPDCIVERTRDAVQIFYKAETGASLLFTPEGFEVRLPSLEWVDNIIPTPTTRLIDRYVNLDERILKSGFDYEYEFMIDILLKAVELRKAEFEECQYCKNIFPRERLYKKGVCHSCSYEKLGIIY